MSNIYQRTDLGETYILKAPETYIKGRGVRYNARTYGLKLLVNPNDILGDNYNKSDIIKFLDFFKLLGKRRYSSQTLTTRAVRGGKEYSKPMTVEDIARIIGKSKRTAYRLLDWCKDKGLLRRGIDNILVVNPDMIMLGNRLHASEYMLYKDILKNKVSAKYDRLLQMEYLGCLEDPEEENEE